MNFFEHQEQARKLTKRLVLLFALAVLAIIVAIYSLTVGVGMFATDGHGSFFNWEILGMVAGGVLLIVGGGSLYKTAQLRSGGPAVAEMLGGRRVMANPADTDERKLMNVVEEMAIAAGIPVPAVYVLDREEGINAFAAGYTTKDAAIGVTRGCIAVLDRDELQGVIAHEFSHILNGDMRLNIRLTGWLHGILCIAMGGYLILRNAAWSSRGSRDNKGAGGILAVAIGLIVIGYVGVFFARLIQAAVSRQREYLADASAVQFTRAPWGLSGALKKIGGFAKAGRIQTAHAQETSHMFFADALRKGFSSAFATHPPLKERVQRIEKGWNPERAAGEAQADREAREVRQAAEHKTRSQPKPAQSAPAGGIPGMPGGNLPGNLPLPGIPGMAAGLAGAEAPAAWRTGGAEAFVAAVGEPRPEHIERSRSVLDQLPLELVSAAHDVYRARCVVYALLLDHDHAKRREQIELLSRRCESGVLVELQHLLTPVQSLPDHLRLPMIDMLLPALREMSTRQYQAFRADIDALIDADREVSLFEFCIEQVMLRHLATSYGKPPRRKTLHKTLAPLKAECQALLSSLARFGHDSADAARAAYAQGISELFRDAPTPPYLDEDDAPVASIAKALDALDRSTPYCKRALLSACATTAAADGVIAAVEAELLRAIADAVDCPVPI